MANNDPSGKAADSERSGSSSIHLKGPVDMSEVLNTAARLSFSTDDRLSPRSPRDAMSPKRKDKSDLSKEDMDILSSLPRQSIASIPSEDDRKRVLGCLAAILSTLYEYEYMRMDYYNYASSNTESQPSDMGTFETTSASLNASSQRSVSDGSLSDRASDHGNQASNGVETKKKRRSKSKRAAEELIRLHRYRKRRHRVYSEFFLTAGDMLLLDKSITLAFLPMLDSLLQDEETRRKEYNNQYSRLFSSTLPKKVKAVVRPNKTQEQPLKHYDIPSGGGLYRSWNHSGEINEEADGKPKSVETRPLSMSNPPRTNSDIPLKPNRRSASFQEFPRNQYGNDDDDEEDDEDYYKPLIRPTNDKSVATNKPPTLIKKENSDSSSDDDFSVASVSDKPEAFKRSDSYDSIAENAGRDSIFMNGNLQTWNDNEMLRPFVETLTPGAGFQCLSLLLLNHLLHSGSGYDARIRHAVKKLAVVLITSEIKNNDEYDHRYHDRALIQHATRKFEALEHSVAVKLLLLSGTDSVREQSKGQIVRTQKGDLTKQAIIRGLKIGGAGILAGALFAVTGGIAAPSIAAAAVAIGGTAATAAVATLTSTAAVTIFGVGGGGLAAWKTHRRTKGVTEFEFIKVKGTRNSRSQSDDFPAELFTTVCISGWLRDYRDFQRPWGITPNNPPISDKAEKLIRFYSVYKPENIDRVSDVLHEWKGNEKHLWEILRKKYGRDPDHLLPFEDGPRHWATLTHEEEELLESLLSEIGFKLPQKTARKNRLDFLKPWDYFTDGKDGAHSMRSPTSSRRDVADHPSAKGMSRSNNRSGSQPAQSSSTGGDTTESKNKAGIFRVWDYHSEYGGELYTVRWESDLLIELCDSVAEVFVGMAGTAARMVLKQTAMATFISAIALPYALVSAANIIDSAWTLATERADEAGVELARSLLESPAGHRPVTLVGFSFGARTIFSCLRELARHQIIWEEQNDPHSNVSDGKSRRSQEEQLYEYNREPASIVEDAILMGAPLHLDPQSWEACRLVLSGRLINCYAPNDQILTLMFQFKMVTIGSVCGTVPVPVAGVENYDVSALINAHSDYCLKVEEILQLVRHGQPHVISK